MNEARTINADVTMSGAVGVLLAGRYRVIRQLGQGGMGSVWLAEDTKLDGRKVMRVWREGRYEEREE